MPRRRKQPAPSLDGVAKDRPFTAEMPLDHESMQLTDKDVHDARRGSNALIPPPKHRRAPDPLPGPGSYGSPMPFQPDTSFRISASKKGLTPVDLQVQRSMNIPGPQYDGWERRELGSRRQKRGGQFSKSAPALPAYLGQEEDSSEQPGPGAFDTVPLDAGIATTFNRRDSKSLEMERLRRRKPDFPGVGHYDPQLPKSGTSFRLSPSKKPPTDTDLAIRKAKAMPGPADFAPVDDTRSLARQKYGATLNTSGRGWEGSNVSYRDKVDPDTLALALEMQSPGPM